MQDGHDPGGRPAIGGGEILDHCRIGRAGIIQRFCQFGFGRIRTVGKFILYISIALNCYKVAFIVIIVFRNLKSGFGSKE